MSFPRGSSCPDGHYLCLGTPSTSSARGPREETGRARARRSQQACPSRSLFPYQLAMPLRGTTANEKRHSMPQCFSLGYGHTPRAKAPGHRSRTDGILIFTAAGHAPSGRYRGLRMPLAGAPSWKRPPPRKLGSLVRARRPHQTPFPPWGLGG